MVGCGRLARALAAPAVVCRRGLHTDRTLLEAEKAKTSCMMDGVCASEDAPSNQVPKFCAHPATLLKARSLRFRRIIGCGCVVWRREGSRAVRTCTQGKALSRYRVHPRFD